MNKGYQSLKQLEDATVQAVGALEKQIDTMREICNHNLANAISGEIHARHKLADEQRRYVDQADIDTFRRVFGKVKQVGFWARIWWVLSGNLPV